MRPAAGVASAERHDRLERRRATPLPIAEPRRERAASRPASRSARAARTGAGTRPPPSASMPRARQFGGDAVRRRSCRACRARRARRSRAFGGTPAGRQQRAAARRRWLSRIVKSAKPSVVSTSLDRREDLGLDDGRRRSHGVDVALVELAEPAARRPVGAPHRLDLVAPEELRQRRSGTRRRRARAAPSGRSAARDRPDPLASCSPRFRILKMSLFALVAVLAEQRLDVLERRRLERLEPVALVHARTTPIDVLAAANVVGQEVARAARGLGRRHMRDQRRCSRGDSGRSCPADSSTNRTSSSVSGRRTLRGRCP